MNKTSCNVAAGRVLLWCSLIFTGLSAAAVEQKFDVLQVGTNTYKNVTVTTKADTYVLFLHSSGLTSLKVSQMSPDVRQKLGYASAPTPVAGPVAVRAKEAVRQIPIPDMKSVGQQMNVKFGSPALRIPPMGRNFLIGIAVLLVAIYGFYCFCCRLICIKTGEDPGLLIWLPGLQMIPLLKAAGISPWWFLGCFVPVLNIVVTIMWCLKIAEARNKSAWVGFFLIFPVTSLFAFLYLAFSDSASDNVPPVPSSHPMTPKAA